MAIAGGIFRGINVSKCVSPILLFQQEKLSLGKASELLGLPQIRFQQLLSDRGICVHYDVAEFREDLQHLSQKGWL